MWIVALAFCFAGWRYNAVLLVQCVVVAFGVSLVLKALVPKVPVRGVRVCRSGGGEGFQAARAAVQNGQANVCATEDLVNEFP